MIYESTCLHCAKCSTVFDQTGMTAMPYPSNSPNLSLSNFFFKFWFPQMKKVLKGKNFANVEEEKQKWQKH